MPTSNQQRLPHVSFKQQQTRFSDLVTKPRHTRNSGQLMATCAASQACLGQHSPGSMCSHAVQHGNRSSSATPWAAGWALRRSAPPCKHRLPGSVDGAHLCCWPRLLQASKPQPGLGSRLFLLRHCLLNTCCCPWQSLIADSCSHPWCIGWRFVRLVHSRVHARGCTCTGGLSSWRPA